MVVIIVVIGFEILDKVNDESLWKIQYRFICFQKTVRILVSVIREQFKRHIFDHCIPVDQTPLLF